VRVHDPEFKSFYRLKYTKTPKIPRKRVFALPARNFVWLVYVLLGSNRIYTPCKVKIFFRFAGGFDLFAQYLM